MRNARAQQQNKAKDHLLLHRAGAIISCVLISLCIMLSAAGDTDAETVTDTLTIKIGYWGMDETDYVTKAEFHWTELQAMYGDADDLPEIPYTYFQGKEDGSYKIVVASARGVLLEDVLNYAGVNISDVKNISFYTNDYSAGAFVSFTPYQLLEEPRYYYDNLAAHINNEYNDLGVLTGYEIDPSAEDAREQVPTMLALESNWSVFEAGTPNTNPSFSGLSTSSRFRLLFGQNAPDETNMTSKSAKYVHTIALTIPGTPEVKGGSGNYAGKIMLSQKVGAHTVQFDVAADEAMLDSIMDKLVWTSTDETVLRIDDVRMGRSAEYDDAVTVQIDYTVLKEGNAGINGNYMGMDLSGSVIETDENAPEESGSQSDQDKEKDKEKTEGADKKQTGGSGKDGSSGTAAGTGNRKYSLTKNNGNVSKAVTPAGGAAAQQEESKMVSMDLESIFNPEEKETRIVAADKSRKYIPYLCGGIGALMALGGTASALQFKSQLGQIALRIRRRGA